ncbi:MAG: recombinase family protein, partial [Promethearchaeota archaeon]
MRGDFEACASRGYRLERVYRDVGSGLNDRRPGLLRLVDRVCAGGVDAVVVATRDRLARFGAGAL